MIKVPFLLFYLPSAELYVESEYVHRYSRHTSEHVTDVDF